jgi:hypothetical protein
LHKNKKKINLQIFLKQKILVNFYMTLKCERTQRPPKNYFKILLKINSNHQNLAYMIYMYVISINVFIFISLKIN